MAMRNCYFAFGIIFLLITAHFSAVHCRNLRPRAAATVSELKETGGEMVEFIVSSSNNTDRRMKMRSIAYKLASGPSKRGPGH
ncbi:hypothetical protein QVD17_02391 [Tagetes erecta]|uniref:Uncharacterized protein n=1 Tax=Tagetes erecta TaxID=13708 RepID=A0AAD8P8T3_TARER|nr:hypothetical protein QVD17_02391 [Tagetes erecta]